VFTFNVQYVFHRWAISIAKVVFRSEFLFGTILKAKETMNERSIVITSIGIKDAYALYININNYFYY